MRIFSFVNGMGSTTSTKDAFGGAGHAFIYACVLSYMSVYMQRRKPECRMFGKTGICDCNCNTLQAFHGYWKITIVVNQQISDTHMRHNVCTSIYYVCTLAEWLDVRLVYTVTVWYYAVASAWFPLYIVLSVSVAEASRARSLFSINVCRECHILYYFSIFRHIFLCQLSVFVCCCWCCCCYSGAAVHCCCVFMRVMHLLVRVPVWKMHTWQIIEQDNQVACDHLQLSHYTLADSGRGRGICARSFTTNTQHIHMAITLNSLLWIVYLSLEATYANISDKLYAR